MGQSADSYTEMQIDQSTSGRVQPPRETVTLCNTLSCVTLSHCHKLSLNTIEKVWIIGSSALTSTERHCPCVSKRLFL